MKGVKIGTDGLSISFQPEREDKRAQGRLSTLIADLWAEIARDFQALCVCLDETDVLAPEADGPTTLVGRAVKRLKSLVQSPFLPSFAYALRSMIETLTARKIGKVKFIVGDGFCLAMTATGGRFVRP